MINKRQKHKSKNSKNTKKHKKHKNTQKQKQKTNQASSNTKTRKRKKGKRETEKGMVSCGVRCPVYRSYICSVRIKYETRRSFHTWFGLSRSTPIHRAPDTTGDHSFSFFRFSFSFFPPSGFGIWACLVCFLFFVFAFAFFCGFLCFFVLFEFLDLC